MKTLIGFALASGLLLPSSAQTAPDPSISLTVGSGERRAVFRIEPDGAVTIDRSADGKPFQKTVRVGSAEYRATKALVAPSRQWAGGRVPCNAARDTMKDDWFATIVTVSWDGGPAVSVPVNCTAGPAQDQIELVRMAVSFARSWEQEVAMEFDGAANAAYYNATTGDAE